MSTGISATSNIKTSRLSNIELCRLFAIVLVLIVHTTFRSIGTTECTSFGILLLAALSVVGVNVFVFITGYFSATPKKTSLIQIAFVCLFWAVVKVGCYLYFNEPISYKNFFFITDSNWFIPSYICLLFIAPFLNIACKNMSKEILRGGVLFLLIIRTWFDWIPPYPSVTLGNQAGHGVLSFIIIYLLARYIKMYGMPKILRQFGGTIYIILSVLTAVLSWVCIKIGHPAQSILYSYNSPLVIVASIGLFAVFERKQFESRVINHLAKSVLSVLLGHSAIFIWYTAQYKYLFHNFSGSQMILYWIVSLCLVLIACVMIDQIRIVIWERLLVVIKRHIENNDIYVSLE